jgi:hypothetical protein
MTFVERETNEHTGARPVTQPAEGINRMAQKDSSSARIPKRGGRTSTQSATPRKPTSPKPEELSTDHRAELQLRRAAKEQRGKPLPSERSAARAAPYLVLAMTGRPSGEQAV